MPQIDGSSQESVLPGISERFDPDARTADAAGRVRVHDLKPRLADVRDEVRTGLLASPRRLAPKFFYDERGSELFEEITRQPEYYPTRTEIGILGDALDEIADVLGRDTLLVEYGSGSSRKIRLLLEGLRPRAYMPIDISTDHLRSAAIELAADHDWLEVHAVCADYSQPLMLPWRPAGAAVSAFFPGSSIGNFERPAAAAFLGRARDTLGAGARLLVGVDRRKSRSVLEAAYNDAAGVTAAFNLNVLAHLQAVLGGEYDPADFEHLAFYDEDAGRIEMHLQARRACRLRLGDTEVRLAAGERLHTENSYKYAPEEFRDMARGARFRVLQEWSDADDLFSVFALEAEGA